MILLTSTKEQQVLIMSIKTLPLHRQIELIVDDQLVVTLKEACQYFGIKYSTAWYRRYHKAESWESIFGLEDINE